MTRGRGPGETLGLLARAKTSKQAFSEFYAKTSPAVLRYFARETKDAQAAFDLTAETFANAYEKRRDFRGATDAQAGAWLWTIARHELARYRRARKVEFSALARLALERPSPTTEELRRVEALATLEEAQGHLSAAIELLPKDQRTVIRMRFMDMLSYEQIATSLGVTQDVARARTSRAIRSLRRDRRIRQAFRALEA